MVWCCFFVRTQVSSLRQDRGWTGLQFPPKPGWTMPGAEVWEGAAVCISQETDQGAAQRTWTVEAHFCLAEVHESEKGCAVVPQTSDVCVWWGR